LVDGGFNERRADRFSLPVSLSIVWDGFLVVANIGLELCHADRQFLGRGGGGPHKFEIDEQLAQPRMEAVPYVTAQLVRSNTSKTTIMSDKLYYVN
jgi:hypothetical protein